MGLPEVAQPLRTSADISIRKTSIESKEESSPEVECATSPKNFAVWNERSAMEFLNHFTEATWHRQLLSNVSMNEFLPTSPQILQEQIQYFKRLYESFVKSGLVSPLQYQTQTNHTSPSALTDNHFNLSLLADVAYSHSSSDPQPSHYDDNKQQALDFSKKNESSTILKCKRIRNNEACRKSRLRRKLLNEAAKEQLVSLAHDNDLLKRRIFTLEEEVKVVKAALFSRLRTHPQYGQNPELVFASLLYAYEELSKTFQREQKKNVIDNVVPK